MKWLFCVSCQYYINWTTTENIKCVMSFPNWVLIALHFSLSVISISFMSSDPPTFSEPADEMRELPGGSKTILNCTATGNPVPVYKWHLPHTLQQMNKDESMNQPILTVSVKHRETYNCTVSNSQGSKTKHFTVSEAKSKILPLK